MRSSRAALSSLVEIDLGSTFSRWGSVASWGSWRKVILWRMVSSEREGRVFGKMEEGRRRQRVRG
jgi:hypothetical protein